MCALGGREGEQHSVRRDGPCQGDRRVTGACAQCGDTRLSAQPLQGPDCPQSVLQHPTVFYPALLESADTQDSVTATSVLLPPLLCC